ncbi:hypothetical protein BBP40_010646, partial [Aspergillus hancockii]
LLGLLVSADKTCSGSANIASQADADSIKECETINSPLTIPSAASGTISLPEVKDIKGPLTISGTSSLNGFSASDLEAVSGPITIEDNGALNSISLSNLETAGGEIKVQGNGGLREVVFDDLKRVNGALVLKGEFDRISFANLEEVYGDTQIKSTGSFLCSSLAKLKSDKNAFKGSFSCSENGAGLSSGAKAGIAIGVIIGVITVLLLVWFCIRRQKKLRRTNANTTALVGATAAGAAGKDVEKGDEKRTPTTTTVSDTSSPVNSIPRKPLSPPPPQRGTVPAALVPGDRSSAGVANGDDPSLFLRTVPRRRPSESEVPMLDSGDVHEAPFVEVGRRQSGLFELDAGPVSGRHQQVIHRE